MKKKPLASIMESKFKKLVIIFFVFFTAILLLGSLLLYNNFFESAKKDVYNDINFYFMELDNNFSVIESRVNDIFRDELNNIYENYGDEDFTENNKLSNIEKRIKRIEALNNNIKIDDLNYYLISDNGKIIDSNFKKDINLDLSKDVEIWENINSLEKGEIYLDSFDDEKRSNDVNIYSYLKLDNGNIFELGLSFSNINLIIKKQLNYLLSDKTTNISLYTDGFTPYFNNENNLEDNEKKIFQNSIENNKMIEKNTGFFTKNYYRGWNNNYGNRFVKVKVEYNLYKNAIYTMLLIFVFVLGFQLFLHYSFKDIVGSVTKPIKYLSKNMNEFKINENTNFNIDSSKIKEIDDIQHNFKEMTEEVNISYDQLEAYNKEIMKKNKRLNQINKALDTNKRKYKSLFNNMLDGFAYYKINYDESMQADHLELIEANDAFEKIFNLESKNNKDNSENHFPISKEIILDKYNKIIQGEKDNFKFEKYYNEKDRWLNINIFSTYKGYLAIVISDITEFKKSKKEAEKLSINLEKIISLTSTLATNELDENDFLKKLLKTAVEVIPEADYGTVYKNKDNKVKFVHAIGHDYDKFKDLSIDEKYFYNDNKEIEVIENIMENNETKFDSENLHILKSGQKDIKETMTFDLIIDNKVVAGLNIDIKLESEKKFDEYSKRLFKSLKNISTSFYKMRKYNILQNKFTRELILSIIRMLEIHDLYTRGHSEKVANLSKDIAKELGLSERKVNDAYWAGMVHDIGKILIPDYILNKESPLKDNEFEIIKKHSIWGYQTLSATEDLQNIARFVLFHHERWDGKGYPRGLKGDKIPLISRILAVADAWDAMTTDRAYRKALSDKEAIEELKNNKGEQFDPQIVNAFLKGHLS
ncbi:MAG TPA: HD-GYP domain-containing protein [Halanaerobiales bacterium]|nr:HD-GYP domain-containing protein [Halanaerobiales bacterium]